MLIANYKLFEFDVVTPNMGIYFKKDFTKIPETVPLVGEDIYFKKVKNELDFFYKRIGKVFNIHEKNNAVYGGINLWNDIIIDFNKYLLEPVFSGIKTPENWNYSFKALQVAYKRDYD